MKFAEKLIVFTLLCLSMAPLKAGSFEDFFAAARQDNETAIVALALRGFDLNTRNEGGETALMVALRDGSLKVADFLLTLDGVEVEVRNPRGESALMLAALRGHLSQAQRLIARKAEVNKPGWAPLHYAATNATEQALPMTRLLLEHHAYIDAESPNKTTPLMMAAHYGHPAVVKLLLEEGADPLLRNEQGLTAIDFATRAGRKESAELIAAFVRSRQPAGTW